MRSYFNAIFLKVSWITIYVAFVFMMNLLNHKLSRILVLRTFKFKMLREVIDNFMS